MTAPPCFGVKDEFRANSLKCVACFAADPCKQVALEGRTLGQGMAAIAARVRPKEADRETDPNGLDPHAPGAKLDAGKVRPDLILDGFSLALWAVAEVGTYGAKKYTENGWASVDRGEIRYRAAAGRHRLKRGRESHDPDTQLLHLAHEAWNVLAELELHLRKESA